VGFVVKTLEAVEAIDAGEGEEKALIE